MKSYKKNVVLLITVIGFMMALCGCGASNSERRTMYEEIIKKGELNLDVAADEYEKKENVSNAPVPGGHTYYIYRGIEGEKYTFNFMSSASEEYDYKVVVSEERGNVSEDKNQEIPEVSISYAYLFKKRNFTKKIKLTDSEQSSYYRRFSSDDSKAKCGIEKFEFYCKDVTVYFDKELIDPRIENCFTDDIDTTPNDFDLIIGTDRGEYKSEEIRAKTMQNENYYVMTATNHAEGTPEWVEINGVRIDVGY